MTLKNNIGRVLQFAIVLPMLLTGCVSVELPKHMVSDTIGAGKDLVHTIANWNEVRFSNTTVGDLTTDVDALKKTCVDELVSRTRVQMANENLEYKIVDQSVGNREQKVIVSCQIAVKS
jgi:hypothetical protein